MPQWMTSPQGSGQWLKERQGCLTASRMADAMAFDKKGNPLKARRDYQIELLAERMTGLSVERYVSPAMIWGMEHEEEAKQRYEEYTGNLVIPCGFALHDTIEYCGASPDGLVGDDGLIEVKCPTSTTHLEWLLDSVVPEKHKPQMLLQMAVTGRKWCDFVSYDPRFGELKNLFCIRYEPLPEEIETVEEGARKFLEEIDLMWEVLTTT